MIKAILIDDERKSTLTLKKLLGKYCPDFIVDGDADNISDALKIIQEKDPDVVFLDIEMADGTGFDLIKKFDNPFFRIVFVTAHSQYALKAFRYSATDYLLKPVDIDDLKRTADRIRNAIRDGLILKQADINNGRILKLRAKKDFLSIPLHHIVRMTAQGSYTKITLINKEEHLVSFNLGTMEEKLGDKKFFRVHRSEIINMNHIIRVVKSNMLYAELSDGSKVEISRRNRGAFFAILEARDNDRS